VRAFVPDPLTPDRLLEVQALLTEGNLRDPHLVHTLPGYRVLHGVTHMTAWRDLEGLRRRRLLAVGAKQGRAITYVAPSLLKHRA
jgi:hypothetical protein